MGNFYDNINKLHINRVLKLNKMERFVFSVLCATLFTSGLCHWLLDLSYKYIPTQVSSLHVDFQWVFWISLFVVLYYSINSNSKFSKRLQIDIPFLIIVQTLFLCGVLDYQKERYATIPYTWILPMAYLCGKAVLTYDSSTINKRILMLYFSLAVGMFLVGVLDFEGNMQEVKEYGTLLTEEWEGFWTGEWQNRCTMEFGGVLITSAYGYTLYNRKKRWGLFFLHSIALVLIIIFDILVTGKENIILFLMTIVLTIILYMYDNWNHVSLTIKKALLYVLLGMTVIFLVLVFIYYIDFANFREIYWNGEWLSGVFSNVRFSMDWNGFKSMIKYPLSDYELEYGLEPPHSMVLEYGRVYGITVFIGLSLFRILTIKDAFVLALDRKLNSTIKYLLFPAFTCVNLYYSMEPNGHALRYIWMPGLFISGMIRGWYEYNNTMGRTY
ncbi:hypothetical protein [Pseudobutyrivibrio xylanivorans]|uniref:O-antigen ligase family protein n=1 Tax=Pseudobutyrivibrio xylanivorans TaxID=185007 RepID=A0A1G5S687_PSEXY|nr:hypothetical protein [Pseudobutyrivibrio xylanivorans]SCZ81241.1 hypothetical protein SAMN02910350_02708 [Pseudobutyrivibrio xylanivorans]